MTRLRLSLTPIAQLPGRKILETMESGKSLEEELLAEVICPECGEHHEHGECFAVMTMKHDSMS